MSRVKQFIAILTIIFGVSLLAVPHAGAVNALATACAADSGITSTNTSTDPNAVCNSQKTDSVGAIAGVVVNTLLFLIGLVAVIMIIIGGLRYTLSAGREKEVEEAKNMILYAVIGLVVAFVAYAVVNWVLHAFGK